jgi:hypothetical protein
VVPKCAVRIVLSLIGRAETLDRSDRVVLDMDSSESPGSQVAVASVMR